MRWTVAAVAGSIPRNPRMGSPRSSSLPTPPRAIGHARGRATLREHALVSAADALLRSYWVRPSNVEQVLYGVGDVVDHAIQQGYYVRSGVLADQIEVVYLSFLPGIFRPGSARAGHHAHKSIDHPRRPPSEILPHIS